MRRSGLSEPYLSMASACGMRGNGSGSSTSMTKRNSDRIMSSIMAMMSASDTKLVSMSS